MLVSQGLFLTAGVTLSLAHTSHCVTLFWPDAYLRPDLLGWFCRDGAGLWGHFRLARAGWPVPRSVSRRFAVHHCGLAAILGISAMNMLIGIPDWL